MHKERQPRKDTTLSLIHLLDVIAAAGAVLIWVAMCANSVGRWLLGG